ncbi:DUF1659 domain-containing protein [Finegoldia magna]|uniref:DUF1659 domain-containing protein n=1 Tax=Finegoldia magna TaxID=1260 RepID=UPI000D715697|nr:DUF1659 domain-containing protein [Finegoldia magna]MCC3310251.1 DUF1659 domain-containing protein [Finegoldia magna]MDU5201468.1 DUF1659 domain-containing protein [Finegoldia magna]MDU6775357.1 DUF1659 domain-containing protein [Finegoldia magna]PWV49887.1 uncharacterized protein DUF1659 [Finegoldia magna]
MKKLKITSVNDVNGTQKKSSKTFSNLKSGATNENLKSAAAAINSLVDSDEKHAYVVEETEL